jgi:2-isopropylmalate synthase
MITDDTLREGLQTPGISFTMEEKLKLAKIISESGVKRALVSYPSAHRSEVEVTERIVKEKLFSETYALGRTMTSDIDTIAETGANISLHLPFRLENLDKVKEAIIYASKKNRKLEVAVVDVIHHSDKEILDLVRMVSEAGADVVQLPDTTGSGYPARMRSIIRLVKSIFDVEVEVHCHNDIGGSISNTIAGIEAGAEYADSTIFGMGERNGIADTASLVSLLEAQDIATEIDLVRLEKAYDSMLELILEKIGYDFFIANRPVYGKNTVINTAGTHAAFSDVFSGGGVSVNVYTGKAMIREILESRGKHVDDKSLPALVDLIKDEAVSSGRTVTIEKILKMAEEFQ